MSWNQQLVKVNNKLLVLQLIKSSAPLSRADISQRSGLTKGTVSSLVNELIAENLCYESGPGESSGGRRPVMLLFNETAGYSIGIDVGVNYILGILTDLNGNIILETNKKIDGIGYGDVLLLIKEVIQHLLDTTPPSEYGVVGIGIGVPGIVNHDGKVLLAPNLGWKNIQLKEELEMIFNLPVTIENEANAGAYGEKQFGAGQEFKNMVYVSTGIGIGVGFILNNELYRGSHGFSGEMGHMIIEVNGKPCRCGSEGCWELYASEQALLQQASEITPAPTLEGLVELIPEDEQIKNLFKNVGTYLGLGLNNIINTFNPDQVIIGNRMAMARDTLLPEINKVIESHSLKQHQSNLQIAFSQLTIYSAALGVSAFVIEEFIKKENR
ncbi:ROK family transcriptional regulator [Bacillus alkalicellulosilyticus]|uniref:ROK family transcriptional regulator n=1 Tax=Alkalihalobacterium alkalicellulosilyticum TaxID=1912214 RepID=UPI000998AA35|nr:ROK family transcriptional regulator [Bacillus alkalicellulosilyticus]